MTSSWRQASRPKQFLAAVAAAAALVAAPAPASAQDEGLCLGELEAENVTPVPGAPALGFGINPAGEAGALGPMIPAVPGTKEQDLAALAELRPPDAPFTVRLNRFFWSLGQEGIRRFEALAKRYTNNGYLVELQLRYHPRPDQEGNIERWLKFVRKVVKRFGPNEGVTALQVTNEVNFYEIAPDASDSSYEGAREALIRGVKTAHRATENAASSTSRSGSTGPTAPTRTARRTSGATCATTAGRSSSRRSTGSGSTRTPARCSRRSRRATATATGSSTR